MDVTFACAHQTLVPHGLFPFVASCQNQIYPLPSKESLNTGLEKPVLSFLWKQVRVQRGAKEKMEALVSSGWEFTDSLEGSLAGNVIPQTII